MHNQHVNLHPLNLEDSTLSETPQQPSAKKKPLKFVYAAAVLLILVSIGYAVYDFKGASTGEAAERPTPVPEQFGSSYEEPTPIPIGEDDNPYVATQKDTSSDQPSEKKESAADPVDKESGLDRSDVSLIILNGSGVTGAAGKMRDRLESLGYSIESVGNADSQDYEETVIEANGDTKKYLEILENDLSDYTIGETTDDFSGNGIRIIIGKE